MFICRKTHLGKIAYNQKAVPKRHFSGLLLTFLFYFEIPNCAYFYRGAAFLRCAGRSERTDYTKIRAALPPDFSLVTRICLSIRSFSSATWEMMPTRRLPSVSPAKVA